MFLKQKKIKQVNGRKNKGTVDQSLRFNVSENEILNSDKLRVEEERNIKSDFLSFTKISAAQAKLNSTTEECEQHEHFVEIPDQTLEKHSSEQRYNPQIMQLKFAADGAKMSRMSNFLILSLVVF